MSAQPDSKPQPEVHPTPAEQRAQTLLDRIAADANEEPEVYLRDTEVPEGGE